VERCRAVGSTAVSAAIRLVTASSGDGIVAGTLLQPPTGRPAGLLSARWRAIASTAAHVVNPCLYGVDEAFQPGEPPLSLRQWIHEFSPHLLAASALRV